MIASIVSQKEAGELGIVDVSTLCDVGYGDAQIGDTEMELRE